MWIDILLVFALLPLGRLSGGAHNEFEVQWKRSIFKIATPTIGLIFGILMGVTGLWLLAFMFAGWLSEKPDPGAGALGRITHHNSTPHDWYQLAVRGVVASLPYLILYPVTTTVTWMFFFVVAWPLSAFTGSFLPHRDAWLEKTNIGHWFAYNAWEWSEILRYFIVGVVLLFVQKEWFF